jgi:hypothetical protein
MADSRDYRQGIFRDLTGIMNTSLWRKVQIETMLTGHKKSAGSSASGGSLS